MAVTITVKCDKRTPKCAVSIAFTDVRSFATLAVMLREAEWTEHNGAYYCRTHSQQTAQVGASHGQ